jgi:hypothetical protein
MTRGNQRDTARTKGQQKQTEQSKKVPAGERDANKGLTLEERKLRDAEALKKKQEAKQKAAQGESSKK